MPSNWADAVKIAVEVSRSLQAQSQARRNYIEHLDAQAVRNGAVEGFLHVDGVGEATAEIYFPVEFLERPVFAPGFELDGTAGLVEGSFPLWAATITSWKTKGSPLRRTYVGANLAIVVFGPKGQQGFLHYSFRGQSFTNPTGNDTSVTATL